MKKISVIFLSLVLLVCLVSCVGGGNGDITSTVATEQTSSASVSATKASAAATEASSAATEKTTLSVTADMGNPPETEQTTSETKAHGDIELPKISF